jgi:hypothetical protein
MISEIFFEGTELLRTGAVHHGVRGTARGRGLLSSTQHRQESGTETHIGVLKLHWHGIFYPLVFYIKSTHLVPGFIP